MTGNDSTITAVAPVPLALPSTMRAAVLREAGVVELEQRPVPVPGADQVLVRIEAVGVCGSDVHYYDEGRIGDFVVCSPLVLGHEAAGVVVDVGSGVDRSRIGQRVSIEPQRACRTCEHCKAGRYNLCTTMEFYATPPIDGAFAEYAAIQADYAFEIPDTMSIEAAALCEPLSVAIWSARKAEIGPGSHLLVTGAGPIGILLAQVARAQAATRITVSDPVEARREQALRFGATDVLDPANAQPDDAAYDAFIDASGAAAAIRAGIAAVRGAGRVVLVGMGDDELTLPVATIQARELWLTGVFRYAGTWPTAVALAASGAADLDSLVTSRFGLGEVAESFAATRRAEELKVVVNPQR